MTEPTSTRPYPDLPEFPMPVAVLHDDGYFTIPQRGPFRDASNRVGWRANVFTADQLAAFAREVRAAALAQPAPAVVAGEPKLRDAAETALAAYQHRFGSVAPPLGNYVGPIDEEMKALREALTTHPASGDKSDSGHSVVPAVTPSGAVNGGQDQFNAWRQS